MVHGPIFLRRWHLEHLSILDRLQFVVDVDCRLLDRAHHSFEFADGRIALGHVVIDTEAVPIQTPGSRTNDAAEFAEVSVQQVGLRDIQRIHNGVITVHQLFQLVNITEILVFLKGNGNIFLASQLHIILMRHSSKFDRQKRFT